GRTNAQGLPRRAREGGRAAGRFVGPRAALGHHRPPARQGAARRAMAVAGRSRPGGVVTDVDPEARGRFNSGVALARDAYYADRAYAERLCACGRRLETTARTC